MRVVYLRLENVAGLFVGSNKDHIEIDFQSSYNKIVSIQGRNGLGKTVLLSSISPFATVTSLDERSSLSYIIPNKNGYKEIHYLEGEDLYIIKHYYKASKEGHTVKSYFTMNGKELNENGNVTSFLSLVEFHFGMTQEMMRLVRLGSNVNSFITLTPARRKEYIGKLIDEIDLYLKIYKKINDDIRIVKMLLASNNNNLYNCHISDLILEEEKLSKLNKNIRDQEKERDQIIGKISKIQALEKENNIEDLKRKRQEAEASIFEFQRTESSIVSLSLQNTTIDQLIDKRSNLINNRIDIQSKINSYKISIDNNLKSIERLEMSIRKITSNNDIQSLMNIIETLRESLRNTDQMIINFISLGCTSDDVHHLIIKLSSFNQISQMIHTFGNRPTEIYLKLRRENKSIDKFLKDQIKKNISRVNDNDLKRLFSQVFQNDQIITPNCDVQFNDCAFYRFFEMINDFKDRLEEEVFDDETLRYIQIISNNIDNMLNEIDRFLSINIPDQLKDNLREKNILDRLHNKLPFFDIYDLQEYLSLLREYEIYKQNIEKLKQYEHQLSIYKNSGIDNQLNDIKQLNENISFYNNNISILEKELGDISSKLENVENHIGQVTKYNNMKKYSKIVESTLESTNKILIPLESSSIEKTNLQFKLNSFNTLISSIREEAKQLENRIMEYRKLVKEGEYLSKTHTELDLILKSSSTKKGIPVYYIDGYLGKIRKLANNLLKLIFDDNFRLGKIHVDQETFEIPFIKNGTKISDVRYGSQSELALSTMALSLALANRTSGPYNIILLDEIDAGLDEENRLAFLKMLYQFMKEIKAEQVFMISHNISQMLNIPMDVIQLSDIGIKSKLQNMIYK